MSSSSSQYDRLIVERIVHGEEAAWQDLIDRFEGRLTAFVESRIGNRAASEDVVQETFVGFLNSLPNYDGSRPLESYLFSIAAHKLTDHLRREGRRPTVPLGYAQSSSGGSSIAGQGRVASSIYRSRERRDLEEGALVDAVREQIERWRQRGDWEKLKCAELLFVRGMANKDVATMLAISEQTVANHKFDFLAKLRTSVRRQGLPQDVFPELNAS